MFMPGCKTQQRRNVAIGMGLALALVASSCGGGTDETASGTTPATPASAPTTAAATSAPTTEAPTTEAPTSAPTTTAEPTTTAAPTTTETTFHLEIPGPGTGLLVIGDEEFPFTITKCSFEPTPAPVGTSVILMEMRGTATAEGREVEARALRIDSGAGANDSFGYGYAEDPNDFETVRSMGSVFGQGLLFKNLEGTTMAASPVDFERTEGISVDKDVEIGDGSMIFTC